MAVRPGTRGVFRKALSNIEPGGLFARSEGRVEPPIAMPAFANYTIPDAVAHMVQHNSHHLGQIVTPRQALEVWPPPGGSFTW